MRGSRAEVVAALAQFVGERRAPHPVRVAIDGRDAAGKTTLAAELATALNELGRPAICVSADGFLSPARIRHRRGRLSPEGLLADGMDVPALRRELLEPLGVAGDGHYRSEVFDVHADRPCLGPRRHAPAKAVLLLDGVFLLRPQLRDCFELSIRLEVSEDTALARALTRDVPRLGDRATVRERYERRYGPSQRLYVERVRPGDTADIVIDNEDPTNPRLKRWPTAGRDTQAMDLQSEPSDLHLTGGTRRNRG